MAEVLTPFSRDLAGHVKRSAPLCISSCHLSRQIARVLRSIQTARYLPLAPQEGACELIM